RTVPPPKPRRGEERGRRKSVRSLLAPVDLLPWQCRSCDVPVASHLVTASRENTNWPRSGRRRRPDSSPPHRWDRCSDTSPATFLTHTPMEEHRYPDAG